MTWIKPSWAWMLYRAGYSYKDKGQERILALKLRRADFLALLERAVLTHGPNKAKDSSMDQPDVEGSADGVLPSSGAGTTSSAMTFHCTGKSPAVKVQWDPERSVRLERLEYRSIQIGIPAALSPQWTEQCIVSIEDVTERARELKRVLDEQKDVTLDELKRLGLVPEERPFELPEELQLSLGMKLPDC